MVWLIHITLNKNKLHIEGHTESTICSSVSSIMYTSVNALLSYDANVIDYVDDCFHDCVDITLLKRTKFAKLLFDNMVNCLTQISEQYPDCVKITKIV